MKGISSIIGILFIFFFLIGCQEDEGLLFAEQDLQYVRFSLILDKDSTLFRDITETTSTAEVETYKHRTLDTIFVPVVLSTPQRSGGVTVHFSSSDNLSLRDDLYSILPADSLYFGPNDWMQYIQVIFNRPWTAEENVELHLKLISADDASIHLGYPRAYQPMDSILIQFGGNNILKTYELQQTNYVFEDEIPDSLDIVVDFPNGLNRQELGENPEFIRLEQSKILNNGPEVDVEVVLLPFKSSDFHLTYRIYFRSTISATQRLMLRVKLLENINPLYQPSTKTQGLIIQLPALERIEQDAASLWTDFQNPIHRLFGEAWYFNQNDQICKWQSFATHTQPVSVDENSMYNNGQGYHQYQIAFEGIVVGTNPFNLRRYYGGTSVESPGFNLKPGIELYPATNTSGQVRVPPQNLELILRADDSRRYIPMFGEGDYSYNESLQAYEMQLTMHYDETDIGGTATKHFIRLYSEDIDIELAPIEEPCAPYLEL